MGALLVGCLVRYRHVPILGVPTIGSTPNRKLLSGWASGVNAEDSIPVRDPSRFLMERPHAPLVKICGLTNPADAIAAAEAGADWIGLNFYPPSPRFVTTEQAATIAKALPEHVEPVGLFVDRPPEEIEQVADRVGFRVVQLHGQEPPATLAAISPRFQIIRAFRLADVSSIDRLLDYLDQAERLGRSPDAILIDAYVPGRPGGTGRAIAEEVLKALPRERLDRLILAGGLTPENVADRVAQVLPWMVDVAGGVESSPGRKDPSRVAAFVRGARAGAIGSISGNAD